MDIPKHLLPPEGPTRTALADQYDAAVRSTTRRAAALLDGGAVLLDVTGPWARGLLDSVAPDTGRPRGVCATITRWHAPDTRYVFTPRLLVCRTCADPVLRCGGIGLRTCSVCKLPPVIPGSAPMVVAQRDVTLAVGRLCLICLTTEQTANKIS